MPIHDWSRLPAGLFHHFHQDWSTEIARALNRGLLPKHLSALIEQKSGPVAPDVLAIERSGHRPYRKPNDGGLTVQDRPATRIMRTTESQRFAAKANRITIRHHLGEIVAVIEIVSPGNKDGRKALASFVEKSVEFLQAGIHLLVVDLFPPTPRDPFGIHKPIWDAFVDEDFDFPAGKDRILASYESGGVRSAFVEPIAVGDIMPDMPLFLAEGWHIKTPLEATYQTTWSATPEMLREVVETGVLPE